MPYPDSEYPSVIRGRDKRESQRLLAAAPDLLAACKQAFDYAQDTKERFIDHLDGEDHASCESLCDAIDAAVGKAGGYEGMSKVEGKWVAADVWDEVVEALRTALNALDYSQAQVDSESDRENILSWLAEIDAVIGLVEREEQ